MQLALDSSAVALKQSLEYHHLRVLLRWLLWSLAQLQQKSLALKQSQTPALAPETEQRVQEGLDCMV